MVAFLYDLIYLIPLVAIAVTGGLSRFDFFGHTFGVVGVVTVTGVFCVLFRHLNSRFKYMIPGCTALAGLAVFLFQKKTERISFLLQNQWIVWAVLTGGICFVLMRLISSYVLVRRVASGLLVAGLVLLMCVDSHTDKCLVASAMFLLLVFLAEEIQKYWKKSGYTEGKGHLVYISLFLLLISLVVYAVPASEYPYNWNFVVKIWEKTTENIRRSLNFFHRNDEDYADAMIGFSDEGRLMGGLKKRNRNIMHVSGKKEVGPVVYLTGKTFDTFDGREWLSQNEIQGQQYTLDALETMSAVRREDPENTRNYLWRVNLNIVYDSYYTRYIFLPQKTVLRGDRVGEIPAMQQEGSMLASDGLGYGTEYGASFYRLNRDHVLIRDFLRKDHKIDESIWRDTLGYCNLENEAGLDYESYLTYKDQIYEVYLPETTVSKKVRTYLEELLKDTKDDSDKLFRMEAMLRGMQYSDAPGILPKDVRSAEDYLDYFLFHGQEGYCSYFATAFVLLARSEGIPARYVQGYYISKDDQKEVTVTSDMAHAWAEAYIDGVGWVTFEPTPGYGCTSAWTVITKSDETRDQDMIDEIPLPVIDDMDAAVLNEEDKSKQKGFIHWRVIIIGMICIGFLLLFICANLILADKRYRRLDPTGRFKVWYKRNLILLHALDYRIMPGETLEEFRQRIVTGWTEKPVDFIRDYEEILYGGRAVTNEMCMASKESNEMLMEKIRLDKGKWSYYYHRVRNMF